MSLLNPYLNFNGNCEEAFEFYRTVFKTDFVVKMRFSEAPPEAKTEAKDANKIMHVSLQISPGHILMGSDCPSGMGTLQAGNNFALSVSTDSEAETDRLFKELSSGGDIMMPLQKTFWGAYFGMLKDKFGIGWMVSYDYNQKH